jgi:type I restriction enzyme S subunit
MDLLEKYFDTAFAAPDGIKRLRELILTLAMQGKLVPQDPNAPPASELLKEIEEEKERLIKEGKIKRSAQLPEITPEEIPYAIPESWEWVRFDTISAYIQRGKSPKYVDHSQFPVIAQKCIQWHGIDFEKIKFICPKSIENYSEERFLKPWDLLWNSTGLGTLGRVGIYINHDKKYEKVVVDSHVTVIRPIFNESKFLYFWIASNYVQDTIELKSSGSTKQIELATSTVKNHLFPLPPLPEQKRIVAKIEQLMAHCDELEKLRTQQQQKRLIVHAAAKDRLLNAKDSKDFGEAWKFLRNNFNELYSVKENVSELRKVILQLAMQGKLVPQDPNDPPASELLKEIEEEKERLIKEGKIKRSAQLPEIKPEEIPYAIPESWEWVRLNEFGIWKSGSTPSRTNKSFYDGDIPWVKSGEVKQGQIFTTDEKITLKALEECSLDLNPRGSILIAMYGANIGDVGILEIEATTNQAVCACTPYSILDNIFLSKLLVSLKHNFIKQGAGAAQPNISRIKIVTTIVPLPPLPEQKRIVAKIEQLMALLDRLEQSIDSTTDQKTALLNALVTKI